MQYEHGELLGAAKEYIALMKESGLGYFRIKNDKFEIELGEKHPPMAPPPMQMPFPAMPTIPPTQQASIPAPSTECPKPGNIVSSPIVGTFYAAPSPEKPAYVTVGKQVHKGDVLFIIESMKLMNEVTSEYDGVVAEILVNDGETVEFGEPIMRIE
ncbi:MAG: acetyl-CoA carboxylase biotin carboxyl carrier protein [Ruminiclostridium sp.]|nr:acetyl-CoA carboxylase biotin carboxyl carrier protein [Ruminiclostridium sp.]